MVLLQIRNKAQMGERMQQFLMEKEELLEKIRRLEGEIHFLKGELEEPPAPQNPEFAAQTVLTGEVRPPRPPSLDEVIQTEKPKEDEEED